MRFAGISLLLFGILAIADADLIDVAVERILKGILDAQKFGPQKEPITIYNTNVPTIAKGFVKINGSEIIWGHHLGKIACNHIDKNFTLEVPIFINQFLMKIGYDIDISIGDLIPLYGQGELNLAVKGVNLKATIGLILTATNDSGVVLRLHDLSFKPDESKLVGFLNNPEADQIFSSILNVGEEAFTLFYTLEKRCILCILEQSITQIINNIFNNIFKKTPINITCDCLKKKPKDLGYDLKSNLEGLVNSFMEGSVDENARYILSDKMMPMWMDIYDRTIKLLDRKGLLEQFF